MARNAILMKLLPSKYLDAFLDGHLFMNTPGYFKDLEAGDLVRADLDEGIHTSLQAAEVSIKSDEGEWIPIGGLINPVTYRTEEAANYNMFCMYALQEFIDGPIDDRNLAFGDTFVVITNADEFLRRVQEAADKVGRYYQSSLIDYVDRSTYHGVMGPFRKFSSFSYQQEFRMVLHAGDGHPTTLSIGDIRDICIHGLSAEINQRLRRAPNTVT
ncbi:hypothetical protein [Massilia scottii]|uniref:hypothetical protein n=1 Tax=Massilia scottii TaxID=3057166 RepID=UPI002796C796|nr:hypothetical protein [Massilia sp. CCM 9029]MDQ1835017.1 hypothetical protein [Massilia sp. CCM 9029]